MRSARRAFTRAAIGGLTLVMPALGATDYAVVVNPSSALTDISEVTLTEILRSEKQSWDSGDKIFLIMPKESSKEEGILCKVIFNTDSDGLRKYWTTQVFQNHMTSTPKNASNRVAIKLVEEKPNAIAVISAKDVTSAVKVLHIAGRKPGDPGYLLSE